MDQVFLTKSGLQIKLDRKLGGGGEGEVWTVADQPDVVAKVYHSQKVSPDKEPKLKVMVSNPPNDEMRTAYNHISIAWPIDLLYDQQGKFVGYLMPYIPKNPTALEIYNPRIRTQKYPGFTWKYLHHTALNFAIALETLHTRGYVMGDLNESNILISDNALVSLIDTDSFQVQDNGQVFRCPVGKAEYTSPELQGKDFKTVDRSLKDDYFGLAVLIFHLLMEGNHPFAGILSDSSISVGRVDLYCIKVGAFPYDPQNGVVQPRPGALGLDVLHPDLQRLFIRSFIDGHNNPQSRPTPQEWREALERAENSLVECRKDPRHYYSAHLKQCLWCERERVLNQDSQLQSHKDLQQPLTSPSLKPKHPQLPQPVHPSGGGTGSWGWLIMILVTLGCGVFGFIGYSIVPGEGENLSAATATVQSRMTATAIARASATAQAREPRPVAKVSDGEAKTATAQVKTATAQVKTATAEAKTISQDEADAKSATATVRAEKTVTARTNNAATAQVRVAATAQARATATARARATTMARARETAAAQSSSSSNTVQTSSQSLNKVNCSKYPKGDFANLWNKYGDSLGCPFANETNPLFGQFADMPFEKGHLFWIGNVDVYGNIRQVIAIYGGQNEGDRGTWEIRTENWNGEGICNVPAPPDGRFLPDRGIAKVWCEVDGINRLGYAMAPVEFSANRGVNALQNFENAVIFRDSDGHSKGLAYILFRDDQTYVRMRY